MYIVNRERELAQARALSGASTGRCRSCPSLSEIFFTSLPLVPSIEPSRGDLDTVERGTRIARCDALVVKASSAGHRTIYCAVGEWQRHGTVWHHDEHNPAQHPPNVNAWLAVALGKERPQPLHLLFRQPKRVAHTQSPHGA